jgi:hypothetical protein
MEQSINNNQSTQLTNNQNNQTMSTTIPTTTEVMVSEFVATIDATQNKWHNKVDESLGSLFTKDDVKNIIKRHNDELIDQFNNYFADVVKALTDIKQEEVVPALPEDIKNTINENLKRFIEEAIEDIHGTDYIEVTDENFEIDYRNQVCLESYELDIQTSGMARHIAEEVAPRLFELFQPVDC